MPHYWFRVPLDGTADHLKKAKRDGGGPGVERELRKDAHKKSKSVENVLFAPGLTFCDADVFSVGEMSEDDCNWFHRCWDTGGHGCPEPRYGADETVLEQD